MEVKELERSVKVSVGALVFGIASVVMGTFSMTTIYNQFLLQDEVLRELNERIEYVNDRLDKKTGRLEEKMLMLEKTNSDER